jgi:D-serine deaminase-like pyridoxal phosphate-dependent protein
VCSIVTSTATLPAELLATHPELAQLPTPALVLHAPLVRRNIQKLAQYAAAHGIAVRPHAKTHKSREIAQLQLAAGAIGLTVAKVSEAEALTDPGQDVLLAYPPVGIERATRLARLARDRTVRAAVDSVAAIEQVSVAARNAGVTIGLLVDFDVGLGRTGVQTRDESLQLAQAIDRAKGVRLDGMMIYPGHIGGPPAEQAAKLHVVNQRVGEALELWARHGLSASIVSGGSTPTAYQSHIISRQTEIRPGTYLFNDMNIVLDECCSIEDCAARVLTTVVSDARPGQVVIDAGSKTLTQDRNSHPDAGFGRILEYPQARIVRLSEEHGQVDVRACDSKPVIGERVTIVPIHICPCVNLRDSVWWWEPGDTLRELPIDARGRIQ